MVGRRRKLKRKQWLKHPKVVPQKTNLDQNINDSKSHIWNSFIENIISDTTTFLCSSTCSSGHHHSIFWDLKANKNYRDRSLIFQYGFAQNASFILRTSTHLTLKIICFRNLPKTFITVQIFQQTCFCLLSEKHLRCTISWHPRTAFLKHFESKCLYISVYLIKKIFVPKM